MLTRSVLELAELVRTRQLLARTLVEAALRRVEEANPVLNALVLVDAERALAEADQLMVGHRSRACRSW